MITLSNGYQFEFIVSSGALGFDGRGWPHEWPFRWLGLLNPKQFTIIAKTITYSPTKGNLRWWCPWRCINIFDKESVVNAVGLTNPGSHVWIKKHYRIAKRKGYNIIPSIKLENQYNIQLDTLDVPAIEINASCPNSAYLVSWRMLKYIKKPIILKLSYNQVNKEFIDQVDEYVEAYDVINTIPWYDIYPIGYSNSPLNKYKLDGGVSGPHIHDIAVNCVHELKQLTNKPIIGGGGIFNLSDILDFKNAGANAFSIGTCFLFHPCRPNKIIKEYYDSKMQKSIKSFPPDEMETILLTNRNNSFECTTPIHDEAKKLLRGRNTAYFEAQVINKQVIISHETSNPGW